MVMDNTDLLENVKQEFHNEAMVLHESPIDVNNMKEESGEIFIDTLHINQVRPHESLTDKAEIKAPTANHRTPTNNKVEHIEAGGELYQCPKCTYQTTQKSNLKRHQTHKGHEEGKEYVCKICDKVFTAKIGLTWHMKGFHINADNKRYACTRCDFRTNHKGTLTRHSYSHESFKRYQCALCDKQFMVRSRLLEHIKDKHDQNNSKT